MIPTPTPEEKFYELITFVIKNGVKVREFSEQEAWKYGPCEVLRNRNDIHFIGGMLLHAGTKGGYLVFGAGTKNDLDYFYEVLLRKTTSVLKTNPYLDRLHIFGNPFGRLRYKLCKQPNYLFQ